MKRLAILALFLGMAPTAIGEVSVRVCLADGNTPLEAADPNIPFVYPEIMVRTKLTIIVSSDANDYWVGDLFIAGQDRGYGVLTSAFSFPPAGKEAFLYPLEDGFYQGFCFETDDPPDVGDWFIADYRATNIGDCNVGLYEWFSFDPKCELSFSHVHTRDFNNDAKVDFADFSVIASYWEAVDCQEPDLCEGADLDTDGDVDVDDLMLFTDYWLERTE